MAIAFNAAQFKKTVQAQKPKAESLTARTEIQQESKTVFDLSKAPYPIKRYTPKEGVNWFDVVGFYLDNPETPDIVARDKRVGEFTYGIRAFTHRGNQSSNFTPHLCLKRNYGRKCPRCDEYFLPPEKGGTFVKGAQGSGNQDHASSDRLFFWWSPAKARASPETMWSFLTLRCTISSDSPSSPVPWKWAMARSLFSSGIPRKRGARCSLRRLPAR